MNTPESKPWNVGLTGGVEPHVDARWQMRYGVACGVVLAAFLLRLTFSNSLDTRVPFGFFLLGVMIVAWYGGLGPGLFAAAAGLLLGDYFFLPRTGANGAMGEAERTGITLYVINATLISFLMDNLHVRIRKLKKAAGKMLEQSSNLQS